MIDKQIIIDGVDVSRCEHIDFDCANCEIFANMCHENPNCYYKQLKRKEQECEELKEELEAVYDDCKGCSTCNEALYNANLYAKEYRKLKQTLAEIKEIITTALEQNTLINLDKILQKINEVEDE